MKGLPQVARGAEQRSPGVLWWGRVHSPDGMMIAWVEAVSEASARHVARIIHVGGDGLTQIEPVGEPAYDCVLWPGVRFSGDGRHFAFVSTMDGGRAAIEYGVPGRAYEGIGESVIDPWRECYGTPDFIDQDAVGAAEPVPGWTPESQHLVYLAQREGQAFVVVGGHEGSAWHAIVGCDGHYDVSADPHHTIHFADYGCLRFVGIRDDVAYAVTMALA